MRRSPSIVPETDDREIYLVLVDFGGYLGRAWPETDEERTDRETVIRDLFEGQYSDPVRVVAFNTAKGLVAGRVRGDRRRAGATAGQLVA